MRARCGGRALATPATIHLDFASQSTGPLGRCRWSVTDATLLSRLWVRDVAQHTPHTPFHLTGLRSPEEFKKAILAQQMSGFEGLLFSVFNAGSAKGSCPGQTHCYPSETVFESSDGVGPLPILHCARQGLAVPWDLSTLN